MTKGPVKKAGMYRHTLMQTPGLTCLQMSRSAWQTVSPLVDSPGLAADAIADTFVSLSDGKLNAQKAFMTGALKVKGNVMLATKLDGVLKVSPEAENM